MTGRDNIQDGVHVMRTNERDGNLGSLLWVAEEPNVDRPARSPIRAMIRRHVAVQSLTNMAATSLTVAHHDRTTTAKYRIAKNSGRGCKQKGLAQSVSAWHIVFDAWLIVYSRKGSSCAN
jgi:hypothetical protein